MKTFIMFGMVLMSTTCAMNSFAASEKESAGAKTTYACKDLFSDPASLKGVDCSKLATKELQDACNTRKSASANQSVPQ